jgi:hypothetical protein
MLRQKIASLSYLINAVTSVGLGSVYLFRNSFMPYHADVLGRSWETLEPQLQILLKALMEVAGAGWIAVGVATFILTVLPMRRGETWSRFLIPALFIIFYFPTLLVTLEVQNRTSASTPWYGNAVACSTVILGFVLDAPWQQS